MVWTVALGQSYSADELLCGKVAMLGSCGLRELLQGGVAVRGSCGKGECGVGELRCWESVRGSCSVWQLQYVGIAMDLLL